MARTVVATLLAFAAAQEWPISTTSGGIPAAQAPLPTTAPDHFFGLLRRQDEATSLCGYLTGNGSAPITCQAPNFCGFNTLISAFGCCTGSSGASLVGCQYMTKCYDSTAFNQCNEACQSNTMNGWCTAPAFPYCRKYTTGIFSGFDCFTEPGEVKAVLPTPISGYSTLDFSSTQTASVAGQGSTTTNATGTPVLQGQPLGSASATPFSLTQSTDGAAATGVAASTTTKSGNGAVEGGVSRWLGVLVVGFGVLASL